MRRVIAVIGKGADCPDALVHLAYETGRLLGSVPGIVVITGGLGGVMAAAARGAVSRTMVLSLAPHGRDDDAHQWCDVQLRTGLTEPFRNVLLASIADGALMLPGSHGTVQEATVMVDAGKPVIGVGRHAGWLSSGVAGIDHHPEPLDAVSALCATLDLVGPTSL